MITSVRHIMHLGGGSARALLFMLILLMQMTLPSQTKGPSEYQVKAAFIYNFTRFINWPSFAFASPNSPFVIGIVGEDPFGALIDETIKGESIGGRPIIVKRYADIAQVGECHMLFINSSSEESIRGAAAMAARKNILTVGDDPNFIKFGGMIRFYTDKSKIRMQINNTAAKKAQISISSKLLNVAQVVSN